VVGVRSDVSGVRMVGQPAFSRRAAAVHKRLADTTAHRRGFGVVAGLGGPKRAGRWGGAPVHGAVLRESSTAGGPGAGRVAGWSVPLRMWGGGRGRRACRLPSRPPLPPTRPAHPSRPL